MPADLYKLVYKVVDYPLNVWEVQVKILVNTHRLQVLI